MGSYKPYETFQRRIKIEGKCTMTSVGGSTKAKEDAPVRFQVPNLESSLQQHQRCSQIMLGNNKVEEFVVFTVETCQPAAPQ